tara:strand:- start:1072 stop:1467 length:396 start_codon:yes stop_codon:yes gene_type:complete
MISVKARIISSATLVLLDAIWIYFMKNNYTDLIKTVQKSEPQFNFTYIVITYIFILIGLNYCVLPSITMNNITMSECLSVGFIFGAVLYGTYSFTLASIFKEWNINIAIIDVLWGGFLYFISCYILKFIKF